VNRAGWAFVARVLGRMGRHLSAVSRRNSRLFFFRPGPGPAKAYRPAFHPDHPVRPKDAPAGFREGVGGLDRGRHEQQRPRPLETHARPQIAAGFFSRPGWPAPRANRSSETARRRACAWSNLMPPRGRSDLWAAHPRRPPRFGLCPRGRNCKSADSPAGNADGRLAAGRPHATFARISGGFDLGGGVCGNPDPRPQTPRPLHAKICRVLEKICGPSSALRDSQIARRWIPPMIGGRPIGRSEDHSNRGSERPCSIG
jgi:hypothetical protein